MPDPSAPPRSQRTDPSASPPLPPDPRRVVRAGSVYWLSAVAVLGVLDLLRDLSPWLDRAFPTIVLLSIIFFPVVLGLAWVFEWTRDGIRLHRPAPGERVGLHQRLGIIGILSIATFLFVGWVICLIATLMEVLTRRGLG